MRTTTEVRKKISRFAMAVKYHPDDHELLSRLKADYLAEQLIVAVNDVLAEVNLTPEHRHRIVATVLNGGQ
jgi:hypothetical protein